MEAYIRRRPGAADACKAFAEALTVSLGSVAGMIVFATSQVEDETRQLAPLTSVHNEEPLAIGEIPQLPRRRT